MKIMAMSETALKAFEAESQLFGGITDPTVLLLEPLATGSSEVVGFIAPLTRADLGNAGLIQSFTDWRNANQFAYPSRFEATYDSTHRWLENLLGGQRRVMFKLLSPALDFVGHIGLAINADAHRVELDSVQRGKNGLPGLMTLAVRWVEGYARKEFGLEELSLRVLASNSHACSFYQKLGYSTTSREEVSIGGTNSTDVFLTMVRNIEAGVEVQSPILTAGPSIGYREKIYTAHAVAEGWNHHHSDYLKQLQDSFAAYVGSAHALATSSCTGALHLALAALGVGPGDEVLVPAITWVATASAVAYTGATPIFVDVDMATWTMDPLLAAEKITVKTKAIVAVHLYGFLADVSGLRELADRHSMYLVEDAAPAIGAKLKGRPAGTYGHFGCYSFQGAKLLVSGEGGMLVSDSPELFARAVKLQEHGRKPGTFWIEELGFKYKMSNLTAALALGQLERADIQIEKKRKIARWYREQLAFHPDVTFQEELADSNGIHWMTSISLQGAFSDRVEELAAFLKAHGIDTRPVFPNISRFDFWGVASESFPSADIIASTSLNLPSGVGLSRNDVIFVCATIRAFLND